MCIRDRSYNKEFDGFICRDNYGNMLSPGYVTQHFHYVITRNGLKHLRFHDLRHSCASLLLAHDVPMKAIQEWLGHSNFTITANLYSHLEYNAKVNSAETIARVLGGKSEDKPEAEKPAEKKKATRRKSTSKAASKTPPKKTGGRKKKSDNPDAMGESQVSEPVHIQKLWKTIRLKRVHIKHWQLQKNELKYRYEND